VAPADSVLLLAYGGPDRPEDVRPFLDGILAGKPVPPGRYEQVVRNYEAVGGASPLNRITADQAGGLRALLRAGGPDLPVYVGMRHWDPFIAATLGRMAAEGRRRAAGIILAPHPSEASRDAYEREVGRALAGLGAAALRVDFAPPFFDHPLFVEAVADRIAGTRAAIPAARRDAAALVFTAHSVPARSPGASGYVAGLERTAALVAARIGAPAWRLAYQSRSGAPTDPWLEPDIAEVLRDLAASGARDALVAPIGFVADHVEVLYDLDIAARAAAAAAGIAFHRAPTAGVHPKFLELLAVLVREAAGAAA
jgi:ferrochelatase